MYEKRCENVQIAKWKVVSRTTYPNYPVFPPKIRSHSSGVDSIQTSPEQRACVIRLSLPIHQSPPSLFHLRVLLSTGHLVTPGFRFGKVATSRGHSSSLTPSCMLSLHLRRRGWVVRVVVLLSLWRRADITLLLSTVVSLTLRGLLGILLLLGERLLLLLRIALGLLLWIRLLLLLGVSLCLLLLLGITLRLLWILAVAGAGGRVTALLGCDAGVLWCRAAGIRSILLHFHGNLLHAVFRVGVCGCGRSRGVVASSTILPHPPGGCAEGEEEEGTGEDVSVVRG